MNFLKGLYFRIFYKNNAKKVLGVLTENESYKMYKISTKVHEDNMNNDISSTINKITYQIKNDAESGHFSSLYPYKLTKEQEKIIKKRFKDKGYKISFEKNNINHPIYGRRDKWIVISWNNWG